MKLLSVKEDEERKRAWTWVRDNASEKAIVKTNEAIGGLGSEVLEVGK